MDIVKKIKNYTYNERHCLGEGSFGRVYEGKSDEGLKVAIKRVEQSLVSKDPYLRSSLETEISIMKKLNHPNIVRFYDLVITNNSIYLIMQFCAGGDLKRYCRNRKLSEDEATNIIKQVCKAFQQIVQLGIIHRDLKPANILVHEGVFKLCDFGFAKFFSEASRMNRTCVGTPIYMSPQVLSQKHYTEKTDIWSLGVLYFELVFGRLPFQGNTEQALYANITTFPFKIPSCSSFTATIIKGTLEIDEAKRLTWGRLFQLFKLEPLSQEPPRQVEPPRQPLYKPRYDQPLPGNNYTTGNNYGYENANNYQALDYNNGGKRQKLPKNNLAYQNTPFGNQVPQVQQNRDPYQPNNAAYPAMNRRPSSNNNIANQNPRFLYFVVIELIINPLTGCPSYQGLVAALYKRTIESYRRKIAKESEGGNDQYVRVLKSELEELKAVEEEVPKLPNANLQSSASALLLQCKQSRNYGSSAIWVQKLLDGNYTYSK